MRQRVAIAIALLHRPALIVADEPTTALDVTIQAQILAEMQALCARFGTALVWITHDLSSSPGWRTTSRSCTPGASWRRERWTRCWTARCTPTRTA